MTIEFFDLLVGPNQACGNEGRAMLFYSLPSVTLLRGVTCVSFANVTAFGNDVIYSQPGRAGRAGIVDAFGRPSLIIVTTHRKSAISQSQSN